MTWIAECISLTRNGFNLSLVPRDLHVSELGRGLGFVVMARAKHSGTNSSQPNQFDFVKLVAGAEPRPPRK
jgi:hypothetical protein